MSRTYRVLHAGRKFGQTMENARSLAEAARNFTDIKITVVPHQDLELLSKIAQAAYKLISLHEMDSTCVDCANSEINHVGQILELLNKLSTTNVLENDK